MSDKVSDKIFAALRDDPQHTIADLAAKFGVSTRTVDRVLKKLQQENRVTRSGHARGSQWKVLAGTSHPV
jgi:DeoR/GlpR family transcriptional regulator of sugar metabolism